MSKKGTELKKKALLAKQRLKMGYWDNLRREKEKMIETSGNTSDAQKLANEYAHAKIVRDVNIVVSRRSEEADEKLYRKVCEILDNDEVIMNPIGQLVDKTEYDRLDDNGKQRYILELSSKFREFQERYNRERKGKII